MGKNVCKKCDNLSNILVFLEIPLNSEFIKVEEENTSVRVIASSAEPSQTASVPKQKFLWDFFTRAIPSLTLLPRQHAVAPAGGSNSNKPPFSFFIFQWKIGHL